MNLCEILAINLKYYCKKYNLSQEKFAEILGTSLSYLNQIENNKVDVKSNEYDKNANIKSEDLVRYSKNHITNFNRIDERKKNQ